MNPATTELLAQLALPQSRTFSLREAAELDPASKVYLRYRTGSQFKNSRVKVSEIRANLATLISRYDSGELITCEKCYDPIVAGITLIKKEFAYSEIVQGHSNALLRRGCCGARLIQHRNGGFFMTEMIQKWCAEQGDSYTYKPIGLIKHGLAQEIAPHLAILSTLPQANLMVEWMWSTTGLCFCDASLLEDVSFGDALPMLWGMPSDAVAIRNVDHKSRCSTENRIFIDTLDCDACSPANDGDAIICTNGALLAHFVVRAIPKKVSIHWLAPTALAQLVR
jgi:hypothetical protein